MRWQTCSPGFERGLVLTVARRGWSVRLLTVPGDDVVRARLGSVLAELHSEAGGPISIPVSMM